MIGRIKELLYTLFNTDIYQHNLRTYQHLRVYNIKRLDINQSNISDMKTLFPKKQNQNLTFLSYKIYINAMVK